MIKKKNRMKTSKISVLMKIQILKIIKNIFPSSYQELYKIDKEATSRKYRFNGTLYKKLLWIPRG